MNQSIEKILEIGVAMMLTMAALSLFLLNQTQINEAIDGLVLSKQDKQFRTSEVQEMYTLSGDEVYLLMKHMADSTTLVTVDHQLLPDKETRLDAIRGGYLYQEATYEPSYVYDESGEIIGFHFYLVEGGP